LLPQRESHRFSIKLDAKFLACAAFLAPAMSKVKKKLQDFREAAPLRKFSTRYGLLRRDVQGKVQGANGVNQPKSHSIVRLFLLAPGLTDVTGIAEMSYALTADRNSMQN
jgi:hypothetical protein